MEPTNPNDKPVERKKYRRPELTVVSLRPEEAVLQACKVAAGAGPGGTCGIACAFAAS